MKKPKKYDFSGYATKVGVKCSDGRTILPDAFAHMDGVKVPLVYQHLHNDPKNVLGYAILEHRADGVYAYASLNDTESGKTARALIKHGDISALSIYANALVQKSQNVAHGVIREVSLVLSGANPEAYIDNLAFEHSAGGIVTDETEAIITLGAKEFDMAHDGIDMPEEEDPIVHADNQEDKETVGDIIATMNEKQKAVMEGLIAQALEVDPEEDPEDPEDVQHSNIEGDENMKKNLFDKQPAAGGTAFTREDLRGIFTDARNSQSNAFEDL